jgi:MFS family permease
VVERPRRPAAGDHASYLKPSTILWAVVAAVGVGVLNMSGDRIDGAERIVGAVVLVLVAVASWRLLPTGTLWFARGLPSVIGVRAAMGGSFLAAEAYLPLMLRDEHGYSPAQAGAVLAVSSVAWALGSWLQGRLGEGVDRYRVMLLGVLTFAAMMVLLAVAVWLRWPGWAPILVYGVATLGVGLAYPTTTLLTMRLSPAPEIGRNSSALQVGESLTGAVALAVTGVVFGLLYTTRPTAAFVGTLTVAAVVGGLAVVSVLRSRSAPGTHG